MFLELQGTQMFEAQMFEVQMFEAQGGTRYNLIANIGNVQEVWLSKK